MANQWFRMYAEFATDPKVQMLSEADQRRYVMLLCMRCGNDGETLHDDEVAFQLRISNAEWAETKATLLAKGLIEEGNQPSAWDKRQYASDSSTARVSAHRERKKRACNVSVTPPDTDTDTDTEKELPPLPPKGARQSKPKFDPTTLCPLNVSPTTWADWCRHRTEIRKPLTATSCAQQAKTLAGHPAPDSVIEASIANGWQGLFPERLNHHGNRQDHRGVGPQSAVDRVKAAIAAREACSAPAGPAVDQADRAVREPLDGEFRRVG